MACTFLGPSLVLFSIYGLINPDEITTKRSGIEVTGSEEAVVSIIFLLIGFALILVRFALLKYRKNPDFSNDIPLPTNVEFERTNDVNENIRRYKAAQKSAVEKLSNKKGITNKGSG